MADLSFVEMQNMVCQELKIPYNTDPLMPPPDSKAYPLVWIKQVLNEGYQDVFNPGRKQPYVREGSIEFTSIQDAIIASPVISGDTVINVDTTAGFPATGVVLWNESFIPYTGITATSFTGCTGIAINSSQAQSQNVRATYLLTDQAPLIDQQQIRQVMMQGIPLDYQPPEIFLQSFIPTFFRFSILNYRLMLPLGTPAQNTYIQYFKKLNKMVNDTDQPDVIPDVFRKMLVFYTVGRLMIADDKRTGWEEYYNYNMKKPGESGGLYFIWLKNFYAKYNRRVDVQKQFVGSIYDDSN